MRKIVYICQNPFQTMTALIMRRQRLNEDGLVCDAILTDRSSNMERRAELLRKSGAFDHVYFLRSSECWKTESTLRHRIGQVRCVLGGCFRSDAKEIPADYDEIYTLMLTCIVCELVYRCHRGGKAPAIHLVDEGFGCYTENYKKYILGEHRLRVALEELRAKLHGEKKPFELVQDLCLYAPELMLWDSPFRVTRIPKPDLRADPKLKEQINFLFDYDGEARFFENKVTVFEGNEFQDYGDNRDLEVILNLAETVGRENVIVKLHPRTQVNRFEPHGITTTDKLGIRQGVPWEVIAMNMEDDANCVFVTACSGATVSYSLLFEKGYHAILFAKCIAGAQTEEAKNKLIFIERYVKANPDLFAIPESVAELNEKLREWYIEA